MKVYHYNLDSNYISEDDYLVNEILNLIEEYNFLLLVSPQGTGKTEFLNNVLNEKYKYLYTSPTRALSDQICNDYDLMEVTGTSFGNQTVLRGDRYGMVDISKDLVTTMASVEYVIDEYGEEYDLLVVDEIHKLIQYSTFAYLQLERILKAINYILSKGKKVIFTTATPNLIKCLGTNLLEKMNCYINVQISKKFVDRIEVIGKHKLSSIIKRNHKVGKLQVVLHNSKKGNEAIKKELRGLRVLHVNSSNYSDNKSLVFDISNGTNNEYDVLLVTSWADCGINFTNNNIVFMYCIFDKHYKNGDFTIIQQFMARARKCKPILYIRKPELSTREHLLTYKHITDLSDRDDKINKLFSLLEPVAKRGLEDYDNGLISKECLSLIDGIYKTKVQDSDNLVGYSPVTLKYQINKILDKYNFSNGGLEYLKMLFNIDNISYFDDNDSKIKDCNLIEKKNIIQYIKILYESDEWFSPIVFRNKIRELSNSKIGLNSSRNPYNFQIKPLVRSVSDNFLDYSLTIIEEHGGVSRRYKIVFFNEDIPSDL